MKQPDAELWLLNRLQEVGVDVYQDGTYPTLGDRLAAAILRYGCVRELAGHRDGRPETFGEVYERIYHTRLDRVSRGTVSAKRQ